MNMNRIASSSRPEPGQASWPFRRRQKGLGHEIVVREEPESTSESPRRRCRSRRAPRRAGGLAATLRVWRFPPAHGRGAVDGEHGRGRCCTSSDARGATAPGRSRSTAGVVGALGRARALAPPAVGRPPWTARPAGADDAGGASPCRTLGLMAPSWAVGDPQPRAGACPADPPLRRRVSGH